MEYNVYKEECWEVILVLDEEWKVFPVLSVPQVKRKNMSLGVNATKQFNPRALK